MIAPVYIFNRGRPRFVLTSVEVMDKLCLPHGVTADSTTLAPLLDVLPDIVILLDSELCIGTTSAAARSYFGAVVRRGNPVESIEPVAARGFLGAAVRRVAATGMAETIELPSPAYPDRALTITIAPQPSGIALIARDATLADELRVAQADSQAMIEALDATAGVADARINLRGYLDRPSAALARLTGLARESLASVRFVTLLEIAGRVATAEAIEAVIADGAPRALTARLLINRDVPLAVRIGLAALRRGGAVEGVRALIASDVKPD